LFVESNPAPVKWALAKAGRMGGGIRLPLVPLSKQNEAIVQSALQEAGCWSSLQELEHESIK